MLLCPLIACPHWLLELECRVVWQCSPRMVALLHACGIRHTLGQDAEVPSLGLVLPSVSPPPIRATAGIISPSIIRDVRAKLAKTLCFPGATVNNRAEKIPKLLENHPTATKIVIHAGTNNISRQQSELLTHDFSCLLPPCPCHHGKSLFISDPFSTLGRGIGRFSRLLSLHTWLHSQCSKHGLFDIDNFNLFWEHSSYFRKDGLHLSSLGSRMLTANIVHGVSASPCE